MYNKENVPFPLVLDKCDWEKSQWDVFTNVFGHEDADRIKVNIKSVEAYTYEAKENTVYVIEVVTVTDSGDGVNPRVVGAYRSELDAVREAERITKEELNANSDNSSTFSPCGTIRYQCCIDGDMGGFTEGFNTTTVSVIELPIE